MKDLTEAQKAGLKAIKAFYKKHDYMPTRRELSDTMGFASQNAATYLIAALEERGHLKVIPEISRGIKLL